MNGETNLNTLLATMQPTLHELPYVFCSLDRDTYKKLPFDPLGTFREQEGVTIIATHEQASENGLAFDMIWACVTLSVHSSLSAVGFLAAITSRLARAGVSVNPVSGFYHDHLFVPWENRRHVMDELADLSRSH
jgi:hypothetical protein